MRFAYREPEGVKRNRITLKDASGEEWHRAWQAEPCAVYSQGPVWNRVWAEFLGLEPCPRRVFVDGVYVGILPLTCRARTPFRSYDSGINGYGGLLAAPGALPRPGMDTLGIHHAIAARLGNFRALLNPFALRDEMPDALPENPPETDDSADSVSIQYLDLREGFEAQFRTWSKGHRAAAKQGIREGVTVARAASIDDWRAYYEIYQDSLRRWGDTASSRYPWELFRLLHDARDDNIVLWIARHEGTPTAGSLCFYARRHIAYWHGAALEENFRIKAPHVLQYRIAEDAARRGYYWYDMLSSGGHKGVETFKAGFAAKDVKARWIARQSLSHRVASSVRDALRGAVKKAIKGAIKGKPGPCA